MSKRNEQLTVTIYEEDDTEITVTGECYGGCKGSRDSFGVPMEPDDDPEMYLLSAVDADGEEVELSEDMEETAKAALWEAVSNG